VGLGNPGSQYESTRHNAGFWVIDYLQKKHAEFDSWKSQSSCLCIKAKLQGEAILLVKPQKFMNLSGEALWPLLQFYKIPADTLVVIYDDLDLPTGRVQVRHGGSAAGHNGVSDIINHLGTKDFFRIRVGIGALETEKAVAKGKNRVLAAPGPEEKELLEKAVTSSADALEILILEGLRKAQQYGNRR
ncbi:UNVERIFIED_CONTAM: hypothetical protein GTU68_021990, partial [Idotea baltica]|nr:hypothetical protein [Idotea baltica]